MRHLHRRFFAVIFFALVAGPARAVTLNCSVLPELVRAYLVSHVSIHNLSDELKGHTVEQYISNFVDPSKTLLLEADANKLKKDLPGIFETMKIGNCSALEEVRKLSIERAQENENFAREYLGEAYKFDENTTLVMDPKKRAFAKNLAERKEMLIKFFHFQISNYLASEMKLPEARKNLVHRYELITKRLKERNEEESLSQFVDAFAQALDPHSSYISTDALEDFQISMRLSLEGIGASLSSQDGYTVVEEIIPGGAADRAKVLRPKDKIIAVAQAEEAFQPVIDMDLREVVKLIRGKKGTRVRLALLRQVEKLERVEVAIVRDKIDLKEEAAKMHIEPHKLGNKTYKLAIVELPSFYGDSEKGKRSSFTDLKVLLKKAADTRADGVLLNLSRNGGGLLEDAVKIGGLFIKKGGIVATRNTRGKVDVLTDTDEDITWAGPLVILTSRRSASASEILAGSMKDYHRAVVVGGDHTFGKGSVQAVIPLPTGLGAMKVTTGMFFLPGGVSTQHAGVAGDVVLPSIYSNDEIGEKNLDYSLPPDKIAPFLEADNNYPVPPKMWTPVTGELIAHLAEASKARVSKEPKFADIIKEIEEAKKNKGVILLSDAKKKAEEEQKKIKKDEKKSMAQRVRDAEAPQLNEGVNVLLDLIQAEATPKAPPTARM